MGTYSPKTYKGVSSTRATPSSPFSTLKAFRAARFSLAHMLLKALTELFRSRRKHASVASSPEHLIKELLLPL
jgi:hypothetical protein